MNQDTILTVKAAIVGTLALLTSLWGWFGWMVLLWIGLMCADWVVGSRLAQSRGHWSSSAAREGARHKRGMILTVLVAGATDLVFYGMFALIPSISVPLAEKYTAILTPLVILWYILGELGSLAEHAVSMGADVPAWLVNMLEVGRKAIDTAGDKILPDDENDGTHLDAGQLPAEKE